MAPRWKFVLICVLSACCIPGRAQTAPAAPPLTIFFTAQNGAALTPDSIRVTVDKKPAQILSLRSAKNDKLLFALLVDASGSQLPYADAIQRAASQIFQQLSAQGGVGYLGTFTDKLRLSNAPVAASTVTKVLASTQFFGGTSLYDAVAECSRQLSSQPHPDSSRRAIIVLSDGTDDDSDLSLEKLLDTIEPQGIPIFSVISPKGNRYGRRALQLMSSLTGGDAIAPPSVDAGVVPLLTALDQQWELTIAPPDLPRGDLYELSIKTTQKHVQLDAPDRVEIP